MNLRIELSDERRGDILDALGAFNAEVFDDQLSEFQAGCLVDFFMRTPEAKQGEAG